MNLVVPLAGPDFDGPDGQVKAEREIQGGPLLRRALETRPWWTAVGQMVFVLRDTQVSRRFADGLLTHWYPRAEKVFISCGTAGAALSAAAGVAALREHRRPVVVDLADILFDEPTDVPIDLGGSIGGAVPVFESNDPKYSYLVTDENGKAQLAREKLVISNHASAGVYLFRDTAVFMTALGHSLDHQADLAFNGALFVCPMMNGVIAQGLEVRTIRVGGVVDVKEARQ